MRPPTARLPLRRAALALIALAAPRLAVAQPAPVSAWPLRIDTPAGQLSVYQPQPEAFEGDQLSARAAVSLLAPGATDPEFGATWFKARVFTDRDARTVTIQDVDVRQVKLPNASAEQEAQFAAILKQQFPQLNLTFSLDQLEASLGMVEQARTESQQLDNAPPKILFATVPTTLVVLDGDPKLQPTDGGGGVLRVVNTPFILLLDPDTKQFFLKAGDAWMTAPNVPGPWRPAGGVPLAIVTAGAKLSVQNQDAPGEQPPAAAAPASSVATQVLVATEPTELVSSNGPPEYAPLPGNDLLYMSNTAADVFLEVSTQRSFVLLSGRWFVAPNLNGPWTFVAADALPAAFAQIPVDSPKANVLVSVAGTQRALDARTDAYIPQTTAIRRDSGAALNVTYDGDPQFVPVENTPITYASNCADPVLRVDRNYYCCHQAVWYQASAAIGPWNVCVSVPQVIYTIPPSCPVYHCRYVYVYDSTPDVVYCGYLPGYTGCYVYGPTVVYGTGYRYANWYRREFIPRPTTWGFAPRYDYPTASWGFGVGRHYGPTWFAGGPAERTRHDWWGPQGYVDYHQIHQSRTTIINNYGGGDRRPDDRRGGGDVPHGPAVVNNVRNVTINRINLYSRQENATRNVTVNRRVDVGNGRPDAVRPGAGRAEVARPDAGRAGGAARPGGTDDVYAGHDGQVYRRTEQGWQQRDAKGWAPVTGVPEARPAAPAPGGRDEHPTVRGSGDNVPRPNPRAETLPQVRPPIETPRGETPRVVTPRADTPRAETPRADVPRANAPRADTPRADTPRAETPRADVPRANAPRADTPRADTPRAETPRADVPRANTPRADAPRADTPRERPAAGGGGGGGGGGLEDDHAARQRGSDVRHSDGDSGGTPARSSQGGSRGGGGSPDAGSAPRGSGGQAPARGNSGPSAPSGNSNSGGNAQRGNGGGPNSGRGQNNGH